MDFAQMLDEIQNPNNIPPQEQQGQNGAFGQLDDLGSLLDPRLQDNPFGNPLNGVGVIGRRRRDPTEDEDEEFEAYLLLVAEDALDRHDVQGETRQTVRRFAQLKTDEKLIEIMAVLAKRELEVAPTAARTFITSTIYTTHVTNRLKVAVLAPYLLSYVTPLQEWLLTDMQQHARAWQIPPEIINESSQWTEFASTIKNKLTQIRSGYKTLLHSLAKEPADINRILRKLAPNQMIISEAHRARWAFIAECYVKHTDGCIAGEMKSNEFWDYVGDQVAAVKVKVAARPEATTVAARKQLESAIYALVLAQHRSTFPTKTGAGRMGERPAWQETLETTMDLGSNI